MGGSAVKRSIDQVDLTISDDDEQQPSKAPRSSNYTENSSSQSIRDQWLAPSTQMLREDADAEIETDEFDDDRYQRYELYGTMSTKVVGIRYYNGTATVGEFCTVRREPSNPYDSNAIRMDNVMGQQVGHIPRTVAEKISPMIDDGSIVVEGQLLGEKGVFDMPIGLKLFGSSDPVEQAAMQEVFKELRLPLDHLIRREKERKQAEKQQQQLLKAQERERKRLAKASMLQQAARSPGIPSGDGAAAAAAAAASASQGFTGPGSSQSGPSMDDILNQSINFNPRELGGVVNQFGVNEDQLANLPMASQPVSITTKMLPYQLQGLAWLLDRENPSLPVPNSNDTVQLWKRHRFGGFTNIATNHSQPSPKLASGGILADDMGLGKTLQIISLILADPKRTQGPTLIVSPLSVMSNWSTQIEAHIDLDHKLKILTYHGNNRKGQTSADLNQYDVVITNYETLSSEYLPGGRESQPLPVPRKSGLYSTSWRRVVLDEGHSIRNAKSKKAQAAFALATISQSRWVLTGTPIVNNLKDLQSHVRFVGLSGGLESMEVFSATLIRPLNRGQPEATLLLQALIGTLCLRRMKDMAFIDLRLPELASHKYSVSWRKEERDRYDAVLAQAQGMLQVFRNNQQQASSPTTYSSLLEILLRLRQVCNHWSLCQDRVTGLMDELAKKKQVKLSPENMKGLQGLLQIAVDSHEECPVCMEVLHNPVITSCAHVFGGECIERVIETNSKCPLCRAELADSTCLVQPAQEVGEDDEETPSLAEQAEAPSSKVTAMLDILKATAAKGGVKTVVFSQWTSFLTINQRHLEAAGLKYCRLDGSMRPEARDAAIKSLDSDPDCTIMLASLSVCSVGLNLCAASQVIMADSWWSPAIEDQAVDRVYRLGQTKPVNVWRLVMEDSIEARVLEVQQDKRALVKQAFGAGAGGKRRHERVAHLADIQRLLR